MKLLSFGNAKGHISKQMCKATGVKSENMTNHFQSLVSVGSSFLHFFNSSNVNLQPLILRQNLKFQMLSCPIPSISKPKQNVDVHASLSSTYRRLKPAQPVYVERCLLNFVGPSSFPVFKMLTSSPAILSHKTGSISELARFLYLITIML